jgi:phosphoglycolate phosphatase
MTEAFGALGLAPPTRAQTLSVVGLSLPEAFDVLAPAHAEKTRVELARLYKYVFQGARERQAQRDPLFPGAKEAIATLAARDDVVLGIATGKSRRGVARLLDQEGWSACFVTVQTADDHPSKPHPSMIVRAMSETDVGPRDTVMIGDSTFDMEMACRAFVRGVGVAWGYHPVEHLERAGAHVIVPEFARLSAAVDALFAEPETRR